MKLRPIRDGWAARGAVLAGMMLLCACASTPRRAGIVEVEDTRLESAVITALESAEEVDAADVKVEVHQGRVTLLGWVDTNDARRAATRVASSVRGVLAVSNLLRLRDE